jgi:His Kinase A (phospho-acceptor) domain
MTERAMAAAFCPSECCTGVSKIGGNKRRPNGKGKPYRRDLLRAVDFYATVLAMASHDLRQPLQAIVGAHELLAGRLTTRPEREHLERGEQASAQLEEKLDQLVDALQLHQRAGGVEPEPVRLEPIFKRLARQLEGPARRKGIDFRLLPTRTAIMSQPVLLDGILRNLARNPITHRGEGVSSSVAGSEELQFVSRFTIPARASRRTSCQAYSSLSSGSMQPPRRASGSGCSSSDRRPAASGIVSSFGSCFTVVAEAALA